MLISISSTELGLALRANGAELMTLLATLASDEDADEIIAAAAMAHNGTDYHRMTASFLRQMADALDAVEARDAVLDAAGRVA